MRRVFFMCLEAGIASIVLLPLFLFLNRRYFHNTWRMLGCLLLAVYLAAVDEVVGLPSLLYIRFDANINLIPFQYMFSDYKNSILNVLLFMPLGMLLPVLWENFQKFRWTLLFGFCTSLVIELLQLFSFRATDVNDLMTNTLGTALGWCAGRILLRLAPGITPGKNTREAYLVCGALFFIVCFPLSTLATAWETSLKKRDAGSAAALNKAEEVS